MTRQRASIWLFVLLIALLGVVPDGPDQPLTGARDLTSAQDDRDDADEADAPADMIIPDGPSVRMPAHRKGGTAGPLPARPFDAISHGVTDSVNSSRLLPSADALSASLRI